MSLLRRTKDLLQRYNVRPIKHLGQNYSVYLPLLQKLISYASLSRKDIVLEVGAGLGTLTKLLSQKCKKVVAVEIDARLIKILRKELKGFENVVLIEGDILEVSLPPFNKLVSTPPYSLSSPLLFWLLDRDFECGVLTFQEELAQRLVAEEGSKEYGRLTVNTHYQAEVELLDQVPSYMFYPQPDVTSRIVKLKPREPPFHVKDETVFFELVRTLFTQRNKKVRNAIIPFLRKRQITGKEARAFADSLPFHDRRVQRLAPEDFGLLANEIVQRESANISFGDCTLLVSNDVYTPAEDTFLIAQNLEVGNGDMVLDMGTGCGILAVLAAKRAQRVVAVDVNPHAIECARINAKQNQGLEKMDIRLGDLFTPVKEGERFDVILFNPPYLPSKTSETWIEKAWSGGPTGRELIDRFISEASLYLRGGGRIYMIQSSLSNIDETIQRLEKAGFRAYIAAEMKVAFERIVLIKAENYSPGDRKEV